jgi:Methyltransferase domain
MSFPDLSVIQPVLARLEAARPAITALLEKLGPQLEQARRSPGAFVANPYFSGGDAEAAYAMIKELRPRRVLEIGSGNSAHIMRRAARDAGLELALTCIDPAPRREIDDVANVVIRHSVLESNAIALAASLEEKDVLSIDGPHYVFNGTDVPFLLLEVLPRVKLGVVIHVHDIMLPYEYDALFSERNYSEQYLLAGLLLGGDNWEPLLPVYWLSREGRATHGTSFWMRRGAGHN